MPSRLVIGSRGSPLAMWQAEWAQAELRAALPDTAVEIQVIKTRGDRIQNAPFAEIGGKGLFTKEIEEALLAGEVDLAVHSLKDLPTDLPEGLEVGAFSHRADVRDAFVGRDGLGFGDLPKGARVGTSSLRRQAALLNIRPDLELVGVRGNVDTRIGKIVSEDLHGVVLAAAGLVRLGRDDRVTSFFPADQVLPAAGQGVMAIEVRVGDRPVAEAASHLSDPQATEAVQAERALLAALGGGCRVPVGAWARLVGGSLVLDGLVALPDASRIVRAQGRIAEGEAPGTLGERVAASLVEQGAREILDSLN
jgi:hydroxymethylbilane synthase